jgi:hypothetical protein
MNSGSIEVGQARFNTNSLVITIATFIILATLAWVGRTTADSNDKVTRLETAAPYLKDAISEIKLTVGGLVTRPEMDSKLAEVKADQAKISLEIVRLRMQLSKQGVKFPDEG